MYNIYTLYITALNLLHHHCTAAAGKSIAEQCLSHPSLQYLPAPGHCGSQTASTRGLKDNSFDLRFICRAKNEPNYRQVNVVKSYSDIYFIVMAVQGRLPPVLQRIKHPFHGETNPMPTSYFNLFLLKKPFPSPLFMPFLSSNYVP